ALAGVVFTALPMVGLLRAPRFTWVVLALVIYAVKRVALRSGLPLGERFRRVPQRLVDIAVVSGWWGAPAIFTLPYRFRDLPKINYNSHETGAFATVNSVLHGRLMMADAGLIYGPLRSYALTLYMLVAGVTAEQVRLGQVLMNHLCFAAMLALGWR